MFQLSKQKEEQAMKLHRDSLVIDSLSYIWGPLWALPLPAEIKERVEKLAQEGVSIRDMDLDRILVNLIISDERYRNRYLELWDKSGVDVINATIGTVGENPFDYEDAIKDITIWTRLFDKIDALKKVTCAEDIREVKKTGRYGVILGFQDTSFLKGNMQNLELFYDLGVRIIQITYNMMNSMGVGCTERVDAGLSYKGVELVKRMNKLGILVDASHCSHRTTLDIIKISDKPIAFTHTFCKSVHQHDRGKTDEEMKALVEKGGYMGILIVPSFISDKSKVCIDDFLDHIDYAVNLIGVDHVGIGTDWGAIYPEKLAERMNIESSNSGFRPEHRLDYRKTVEGFESWVDWPNITRGLVSRGYSDSEIEKILGLNFLRIFEEVVG